MDSQKQTSPGFCNYRWVICVLMAQGGFGWSNTELACLTSFFTGFYDGMALMGKCC